MDFRAEHQAADRLLGVPPVTDYWRSLREQEGSSELEAARHREFPEGAAEAPDGISRRTMLGLMGASLSLSGLAACRRPVEKIVPYVQAPEDMLPGIPLRYATTMPFRGNALGLLVTSNDGRPTKVEGNELHPSTQGASNVWAQNAIYDLYDPDRSRIVLQGGAEKTWKDFLAYWKPLHDEHAADGGAGLAIVTEPSTSPTEARLLDLLKQRFAQARVVTWAPVGYESRQAGLRTATGAEVEPVYRLDQARVILSLDADFLLHDPDQIRLARAYAAGRRDAAAMNRLYVAESTLSITGIAADHRLAIPSAGIAAFTLALATELGKLGVSVAGASGGGTVFDPKWLSAVAKDLKANAGKSVILAGAQQPPEVHAAVAALNAALGNVGKTVSYASVGTATRSRVADLEALAADLKAGKVKTLVMLGGNPAYDAPADLDFATVAAKAPNRIRLGLHVDETSAVADWHLPQAHFLESWGDARALGGPLSVVQPLIEPLYAGHSAIELLAVLESGEDKPGYDLVRETWKTVLGGDFEKRWEKTLHDGVLPGSELAAPAPTSADMSAIAKLASLKAPQGLELVFLPSSVVHDGSGANSAWLQELPEPVTKLTWDNAALFNKTDADGLGLHDGDLVTLALGERSMTAAALVLPGQAAGSVAIALGYGRTAAGRVGNGVGFDAYPLRTTKAPGFASGLTVTKAGGTHVLALTHEHWSQEGRDIVREKDVGGHGHDDHAGGEHGEHEHPPLVSPWPERTYEEGPQWAMTIDLNACIGCNACVVACQSENNIPSVGKDQVTRGREMHWIRVDRYFSGRPEAPESIVFQPVPCMHCENAPCEQVCPVAATVHGSTGLNEMVYNRCIGTRYCSNNCPYKVRRFNFYNFTKDTPETLQMAYNPDVTVRARGVMEKCSYCVQRLTRALRDAKLANRAMQDGDARTACQQACPATAIEFGDVRDPKSRVAAAKKSERGYDLLAELNTKPRTSYLTRLRNPNPELSA
jgi:molybdopterin-containing oxidoreductase family iron-sulfur binding subunit